MGLEMRLIVRRMVVDSNRVLVGMVSGVFVLLIIYWRLGSGAAGLVIIIPVIIPHTNRLRIDVRTNRDWVADVK